MRHPADRFLYLFTATLTLFIAAVTLLYGRSPATPLHLALLAVLGAVLAARVWGLLAGVALAFSSTLLLGVYISWPLGPSIWWSEELLTLVALLGVSGGCAAYVALLGRRCEQAEAAQRDVASVAQLGVDLVPRELDAQALGRLVASVERMAGAICVFVLTPDDDGHLRPMADARHPDRPCPESSRTLAEAMRDSVRAADRPASSPSPVLTSSADVYLPIISGSGFEGVLHADRPAGAGRWGDSDIALLRFSADLLGALIERDRLQEEAAHVRAMAEADALKANILLSISHDLRTPLAASSATVATLVDRAEQRKDSRALEDLHSIAEDLASLDWRIGELIDLARLEAASWKPNIDWNDPSDLCNVVLDSLAERAQSRMRCDIAPGTPPFRFDLVQLGRALHHLVENALSYSPPDTEVTVTIRNDGRSFRIEVSDRGPGVASDEKGRLFDKFFRGAAGAQVPHGTGLGLSIASSIVEAHGGIIEVENLEPTGACFTIVLDRQQEDTA